LGFEKEKTTVEARQLLQVIASGQEVRLVQCQIVGELDLNLLLEPDLDFDLSHVQITGDDQSRTMVLSQSLHFNSCIFESDVVFSGTWEHQDQLRIVFEQDVLFNSSHFKGQCRFTHAEFKDVAGFDGCRFDRVCSFAKALFHKRAMFRTTEFEGYGLFNETHFIDDTRFANTSFGKGANFTRARFDHRCDFAGVHSRSKAVPIYEGVRFTRKYFGDCESFWRFIKQACQEAGYYQQAGECFYQERCAHFWLKFRGINYHRLSYPRKLMRWAGGIRLLPELFFGRLLFGYGERPVRVLIAAAIIIIACGFFYSSDYASLLARSELGEFNPKDIGPFQGLYFSTVTFTTLGLGDIYPEGGDSLTRLVTMIESLSGICLMSLFVVCLSKRFSRG
jgi:hypothetical protein